MSCWWWLSVQPLVRKVGGTLFRWHLFCVVASRLGLRDAFMNRWGRAALSGAWVLLQFGRRGWVVMGRQ